jgi:hypothetical protein
MDLRILDITHVKELSAMLISRWRQKCLNDAFLSYISHAFNYAFYEL